MYIITPELTIEAIIAQMKEQAVKLSSEMNKKVEYQYFLEKDEEGKKTGKVFVAYVTTDIHFLTLAKCMDMILAQKLFEVGAMLWSSCFIPEHSDKEINDNERYKVGLCGRLGGMIDVQSPELKKK